jgi:hypothetical protein
MSQTLIAPTRSHAEQTKIFGYLPHIDIDEMLTPEELI